MFKYYFLVMMSLVIVSCNRVALKTNAQEQKIGTPNGTYVVTAANSGSANGLVDLEPVMYYRFAGTKVEFGFTRQGWKANGDVVVEGNDVFVKIEYSGFQEISGDNGKFKVTIEKEGKLSLDAKNEDGTPQSIKLKKITGDEIARVASQVMIPEEGPSKK